jgi:hypothetical protein
MVTTTVPRSKGKVNYKVDMLIMVVKEMLPNGAQVLQAGSCSAVPIKKRRDGASRSR